ncbi:Uncharacterized protein dnm_049400 [Desulfonema magnum]|uniref:Uncharacterized protein n=1 Tax=Desulfonema magnum TaxID=45655 RepID=A0A975BPC8_9BACT|nr:Uncharacterized protein dnm_049400 [Desulfonema magnum]
MLSATFCFYRQPGAHTRKTGFSEGTDVPDFRFSEPRHGEILRFII